MKAVNKKNNKYSLKSIMVEEVLPERTTDELGEIVNFFVDLFQNLNQWIKQNSELAGKIKNIGWNQIPFDIKREINKQYTSNVENSIEDAFNKANLEFQRLTKILVGSKLGNLKWRGIQESIEGKSIYIKDNYPNSFCRQVEAARKSFGNPELYDTLIFNYASYELKDFYKKIIIEKSCKSDEEVKSSIEKTLYDLLISNLLSAIEKIDIALSPFDISKPKDPGLYKSFTDKIITWFFNLPEYKDLDIESKISEMKTEQFNKKILEKIKELAPTSGLPLDLFKLKSAEQQQTPSIDPMSDTEIASSPFSPREFSTGAQSPAAERRKGLQEIKNNFNLKSLSLKELMEKDYD